MIRKPTTSRPATTASGTRCSRARLAPFATACRAGSGVAAHTGAPAAATCCLAEGPTATPSGARPRRWPSPDRVRFRRPRRPAPGPWRPGLSPGQPVRRPCFALLLSRPLWRPVARPCRRAARGSARSPAAVPERHRAARPAPWRARWSAASHHPARFPRPGGCWCMSVGRPIAVPQAFAPVRWWSSPCPFCSFVRLKAGIPLPCRLPT